MALLLLTNSKVTCFGRLLIYRVVVGISFLYVYLNLFWVKFCNISIETFEIALY
jgi:hypothetical protein